MSSTLILAMTAMYIFLVSEIARPPFRDDQTVQMTAEDRPVEHPIFPTFNSFYSNGKLFTRKPAIQSEIRDVKAQVIFSRIGRDAECCYYVALRQTNSLVGIIRLQK
jgi:hypothetical protein